MAKDVVPPAQRFEFRPGINSFPPWRGLNRELDRATIPANQLWEAINVRLTGGGLQARGGQEKWTTNPYPDCVDGLFDLGGAGVLPPGSIIGGASYGFSVDQQPSVVGGPTNIYGAMSKVSEGESYRLSDSSSHPYNLVSPSNYFGVLGASANPYRCTVYFNGKLCGLMQPDGGGNVFFGVVNLSDNGGFASVAPLVDLGSDMIRDILVTVERSTVDTDETESVAYFSTVDTGTIYRYSESDGLTTDCTGLGTDPLLLAFYQDRVWIFGIDTILYRTAAGATTSVSFPAGLANSFYPTGVAVWNDELWISGCDSAGTSWGFESGVLLKVVATVATLEHTTTDPCFGVCAFDGNLYYYTGVFPAGGGDTSGHIGRTTNGASFTDSYATLSPLATVEEDGIADGWLLTDGKNLYVAAIQWSNESGPLDGTGRVFYSNGLDASTFTRIDVALSEDGAVGVGPFETILA